MISDNQIETAIQYLIDLRFDEMTKLLQSIIPQNILSGSKDDFLKKLSSDGSSKIFLVISN